MKHRLLGSAGVARSLFVCLGASALVVACASPRPAREAAASVGAGDSGGDSPVVSASGGGSSELPSTDSDAREFDLRLTDSSFVGFVPAGAGPHPVMVVGHGAGGLAEDDCDYWRRLTEGHVALACLRGTPLYRIEPERGYFYPDHLALEEWTLELARVLRREFGARLAERGWIYAGYSQGATMGALMLVQHGDLFARAVFVEGGVEGWTYKRIVRFREAGAERVLFVCGTKGCGEGAERAARELEEAGVSARAERVPGGGHTYLGAVESRVREHLPWLMATAPP